MHTRHLHRSDIGRNSFLLLLLVLLSAAPSARAQQFQWADAIYDPAGTGSAWLNAAALDAAGTAYVSFGCLGDVQVGGTTNPAPNAQPRAFLAQYLAGGTLGWVKPGITAAHLLTDTAGDVYATGSFAGTLTVDGTTLTANGIDYYVARWARTGTLRWIVQGGGTGDRTPARLARDAAGNVYLTGEFNGVSNFGATTLTPTSGTGPNTSSAFVVKLTGASGAHQWAVGTTNAATPGATSRGLRVGADQSGNVYAVGTYAVGSGVGSVPFPAPAGTSAQLFWLKLTTTGQFVVARALPLPGPATEPGFAVDATGYSYLANTFQGVLDLTSDSLRAGGGEDAYLLRLDPNGVRQWATQLGGASALDLTDATDLALDAQNRVLVAGFFQGQAASGSVTFGQPFHPTLNNDLDTYVAAFDQLTGAPQWALTGGGAAQEEGSRLAVGPTGNLLVAGRTLSDTAHFGGVTVGVPGLVNSPKVFVAHSLSGHNTLRGSVFVDANGDGTQNPGEMGYLGGVQVNVLAGTAFVTSARTRPDGTYEAVVPLGTFTTELPAPPPHHTVTVSGSPSHAFTSYGNVAAAATYALHPIPGQRDVQVLLTPLGRARPGVLNPYRLTYRNAGTVAIATGSVVLSFEPQLTYLSSTPIASRVGSTLTWTYANLLPGQTRTLDVLFSLPTTTPVGDSIRCQARIEPLATDVVPADNVDANRRVVTGSFDPNSLAVNFSQMTTTQISGGEWVQYTAHFQNLGTDTAFSVLVRDSLPTEQLNLATLQLQAASHTCLWWPPDTSGVLNVEFPDIRLPNQASNAIQSNGYVRFRVRPLPWLTVGARIRNRALLYFDYNPYVPTNTASTLVTATNGLEDPQAPTAAPLLLAIAWPNPATDHLTVAGWLPDAGPLTLRLLNASGQVVRACQSPRGGAVHQDLDVRTLPTGLYLVELRCGATQLTKRIVIN